MLLLHVSTQQDNKALLNYISGIAAISFIDILEYEAHKSYEKIGGMAG